jgi:hypothetical protein
MDIGQKSVVQVDKFQSSFGTPSSFWKIADCVGNLSLVHFS